MSVAWGYFRGVTGRDAKTGLTEASYRRPGPLRGREDEAVIETVEVEEPAAVPGVTALLAEPALADWNRPEEDAAWAHLQPGMFCPAGVP